MIDYISKPLIKKDQKPIYETVCGELRIEIEFPVGSYKVWRHEHEVGVTKYKNPYGYILDTKASDGDSVDCYLGPYENFTEVYVIRQLKPDTQEYDEPKTFLAFANAEDAKRVYLQHMGNKIEFFGGIKTISLSSFRRILQESNYESVLVKAKLKDFLWENH